jgi:hypothetical protein
MNRVVGILLILGSLACGFFAFLEAGGSHGFGSFRTERLFRGDALYLSLGFLGLFVLGLALALTRRKKP